MTSAGPRQAGPSGPTEVVDFDFTDFETLVRARKTFYEVGLTVEEARKVLHAQLTGFEEMARFFAAHVASIVVDDARVLLSRRFVESLDLGDLDFDPEAMRARWESITDDGGLYPWTFDPFVLDRFHAGARRETTSATTARRTAEHPAEVTS